MFLSAFVPAKALKFIISTGEFKDNCVLNDARLIIAEMNTIWLELTQIAGRDLEVDPYFRQFIPVM